MHIVRNCTPKDIENAARNLIEGKLIAFPTETVYGLGADAENPNAVKKIYEIKGRPSNHPLIVHISRLDLMEYWAINIPDYAWKLAKKFWPGPLTLILKRSNNAKNFITGNQDTVGLRIPNHPIALKLLRKYEELGGKGVSAPSANRFGAVSPTSSEDVYEELASYDRFNLTILDGGKCKIGIESSIFQCDSVGISTLRPGFIRVQDLGLKEKFIFQNFRKIRTPGNHIIHYSPKARIELNKYPNTGSGLIALNSFPTPAGVIRLANPIDGASFMQQLYESFRKGDALKLQKISVFPPDDPLFRDALLDRIRKAAG